MQAVIGLKKEMTQVFAEDGSLIPVTVLDVSSNKLIGINELEKGGKQVMLGFGVKKNPNKAETGRYKDLGYVPSFVFNYVTSEDVKDFADLELSDLEGKVVNVTGITKGKGFQGVVKRWGFAGGKKTHGQSDRMRAPGSIGSGTTPGRVLKGKKMGGRMGNDTKTVENLKLVKFLKEDNLLLVKGAIPGAKNSHVIIKIK